MAYHRIPIVEVKVLNQQSIEPDQLAKLDSVSVFQLIATPVIYFYDFELFQHPDLLQDFQAHEEIQASHLSLCYGQNSLMKV